MVAEPILTAVTIAALAATLTIFLFQVAQPTRGGRWRPADFGAVFSAFVAGWVATELFAVLLPNEFRMGNEVFHFALLFLFAIWMNARWRWALRLAREGQ